MRDAQIYKMSQTDAKRAALLFQQFEFLDTRLMAYEVVTSSVWQTLRGIISPSWRKRAVDQVQGDLLRQRHKDMQAAIERAKAAPKLLVPGTNGTH